MELLRSLRLDLGSPNAALLLGVFDRDSRCRGMFDCFDSRVEIVVRPFCRSGRAMIVRPTRAGCFASDVVAMAVDILRLPLSALGEILPRENSGLDCTETFLIEWDEEECPTRGSDCSEQEDSIKDGGVSKASPRSSSERNATVAEQRKQSIMIG